MARRRLLRAYPAFAGYLALSVVKSLWLLYSWQAGGAHGYQSAWIASQPLAIILYACLSLEAFYLQSRHFPNYQALSISLPAIFTAISLLVAWASSGAWLPNWPGQAQQLVLLTRYYSAGCFVFIALSRFFFRLFPNIPIRANVRAHVGILMLYFAGEFTATAIQYGSAGRWMVGTQAWLTALPLVCAILWSVKLKRSGEYSRIPRREHPPLEALAIFEESLVSHARSMREAFSILPR